MARTYNTTLSTTITLISDSLGLKWGFDASLLEGKSLADITALFEGATETHVITVANNSWADVKRDADKSSGLIVSSAIVTNDNGTMALKDFNVGDIILVTDVDVYDWWVGEINKTGDTVTSIKLFPFEVNKVDIDNAIAHHTHNVTIPEHTLTRTQNVEVSLQLASTSVYVMTQSAPDTATVHDVTAYSTTGNFTGTAATLSLGLNNTGHVHNVTIPEHSHAFTPTAHSHTATTSLSGTPAVSETKHSHTINLQHSHTYSYATPSLGITHSGTAVSVVPSGTANQYVAVATSVNSDGVYYTLFNTLQTASYSVSNAQTQNAGSSTAATTSVSTGITVSLGTVAATTTISSTSATGTIGVTASNTVSTATGTLPSNAYASGSYTPNGTVSLTTTATSTAVTVVTDLGTLSSTKPVTSVSVKTQPEFKDTARTLTTTSGTATT